MAHETLSPAERVAVQNIAETLWFVHAKAYGAEVEIVRTPKGDALAFEMRDPEADTEHFRPILLTDIDVLSKALRIAVNAQKEAA